MSTYNRYHHDIKMILLNTLPSYRIHIHFPRCLIPDFFCFKARQSCAFNPWRIKREEKRRGRWGMPLFGNSDPKQEKTGEKCRWKGKPKRPWNTKQSANLPSLSPVGQPKRLDFCSWFTSLYSPKRHFFITIFLSFSILLNFIVLSLSLCIKTPTRFQKCRSGRLEFDQKNMRRKLWKMCITLLKS